VINLKKVLFKKLIYIISVLSVAITVVAGFTLPMLVNWYSKNVINSEIHFSTTMFLYLTFIPFLIILMSVMKLSKKLLQGKPFCEESINKLKIISICAFIDFVVYLVGTLFIYRNLLCFILTIATMMVFIISSVVMELIKNGIELKEEIDLTI